MDSIIDRHPINDSCIQAPWPENSGHIFLHFNLDDQNGAGNSLRTQPSMRVHRNRCGFQAVGFGLERDRTCIARRPEDG